MTRSGGDFQPRPLKRLFTANQCWTSFLDAGGLRDIEVEAVTKMLACGTRILGVKEYNCDKPECPHVRYVTNSCGSRACPSCGKKATDLWIATQLNRLPDCDWVHLVFTLPDTLWPVFESNRWLLNDVCRLAVENLLYAARKRGLVHVEEDSRRAEYGTLPGSLSEEATNSGFPAGALQRRSESELPLPGPQNGRNGDGNADTAGAGREAETAHPGEVF